MVDSDWHRRRRLRRIFALYHGNSQSEELCICLKGEPDCIRAEPQHTNCYHILHTHTHRHTLVMLLQGNKDSSRGTAGPLRQRASLVPITVLIKCSPQISLFLLFQFDS